MLKCDTFHTSEHCRIILHNLPELVTQVVGSAGEVREVEWFGLAAMNSIICKVVIV